MAKDNSVDAGSRAKRRLQLMYTPDLNPDASGEDEENKDPQQTTLVCDYDLLHVRGVQAFHSAREEDPIHDTPKQKVVMGRKYLAEVLDKSERTVRRMSRTELISAIRAFLKPSRVAHMKTSVWQATERWLGTPAMGGRGYVCSSVPSFEDRLIAQIDASRVKTRAMQKNF